MSLTLEGKTFTRVRAIGSLALLGSLVFAQPAAAQTAAAEPSPPKTSTSVPCRLGDPCETAAPAEFTKLDDTGCTGAAGGMICGGAIGSDTYVGKAWVDRRTLGNMCNFVGRYYVYNTKGKLIETRTKVGHKGCLPGPVAEVKWEIRKHYRSARSLCFGWFENSAQVGRVCLRFPL